MGTRIRLGYGLLLSIGATAHSLNIVTFNGTRGGSSSLNSAPYLPTRTNLTSNYPGTSITGVSALTSAALAGADVAWIGASFSGIQAITALSVSEQAALRSFILGGGRALLFAENSTYAGAASAVNASLVGQFGVTTTGTGAASSIHTFASPSSVPATGHFGSVGTTLTSQFPGWFSTIPSSASVVATSQGNGEPTIIRFGPGALGAGSGTVWMVSDSGYQATGGTVGGAWNTLYSNMLYEPVPEPENLVVLALGLLSLSRRRKR